MLLTAGVDVQDNRVAVVIRAWGKGEESWLVLWAEIYGDPGQPKLWNDLDALLSRSFPREDGSEMHIVSTAVDSGGHHAQDVYAFTRRKAPNVIAIKGASRINQPIIGRPSTVDVSWQGKMIPNGCQLWPVGSDTTKGIIYTRLKITEAGPGCYHWPIGTTDEYFIQLTAEKLITKYVKGFPRLEWVMAGPRNEALDCEVYAYAAAVRAGIAYMDTSAPGATGGNVRPMKRRVISQGVM